jgi:hypothetical protein
LFVNRSKQSQFSVRALLLVFVVYLVGMGLARSLSGVWMPLLASVVGAVSGVGLFPVNRPKAGAVFGGLGGFAGSLNQHAVGGALALAVLGAVMGYVAGRTTNWLADDP